MAMRHKCPQTFFFWSPASDWCHVGIDPSLVDEGQPIRVKMMLQALPSLTPVGDIGTDLFKGEQRFLKRGPSLRMNFQIVLLRDGNIL
jgi:hypothetical protein